jgi:KaiC/GvpD/RAD55 family RecA-like ATPase
MDIATTKRIKTGIVGLDELLGGGYRRNTVNIVVGSAGVGKTIFTLQFLLKGLEEGEKCIFISLDMDERSIIELALSMGWDEISEYLENGSLLVGSNFHVEDIQYLNSDLLNFILDNADEGNTRIVIDSFTPLIASLSYDMRRDVNWFFTKLREIGTTVITLEEPLNNNLDNPSIMVPVFLGDSVIHLKNIGYGEAFNRTLRIIKHRGSWHAEGVFPYRILRGIGIFVEGSNYVVQRKIVIDLDSVLKELGLSEDDIPPNVLKRIKKFLDDAIPYSKDEVLNIVKKVIECY